MKKNIFKYISILKINEYCDFDLDFIWIYFYRILMILSNSKCFVFVGSFDSRRLVYLVIFSIV